MRNSIPVHFRLARTSPDTSESQALADDCGRQRTKKLRRANGPDTVSQILAAIAFGLTLGSEVDVVAYLASRHFCAGLRVAICR
jgi:hypothetical protein